MTADDVARALGEAAAEEMNSALARIVHCLDQLTDEQIWWRPQPELNSIGNLVLHLCGNVRQWIVSGIGGAPDQRNRPAEFAEQGPLARDELLRRLRAEVQESAAALAALDGQRLLAPRRIQGFEKTGLQAIFDSVPHFRGHTQEIIHLTRMQLGARYRFAWTPSTPEEGA